jgi:hypothetical protein
VAVVERAPTVVLRGVDDVASCLGVVAVFARADIAVLILGTVAVVPALGVVVVADKPARGVVEVADEPARGVVVVDVGTADRGVDGVVLARLVTTAAAVP